MMKHLLDEGVASLLAADSELGNVVGASQPNRFAVIRQVIACGINGPIVFAGAKAAYGVELFKTEPEWVDDGVAALAGGRLSELRDFFAHRQVGSEIGIFESHRHRWRLEGPADDVPGQEDSAMNRRSHFLIRKCRKQIGMREHAAALATTEVYFGKFICELLFR